MMKEVINMLADHKQILIDNGIRPSVIRLNVYQYLFKSIKHPTVDDIYRELIDAIPTLSKTSIYNVLSLFVEKGLVKEVMINRGEMRYEVEHHKHAHFVCKSCHQLYDLPISGVEMHNEDYEGFKIEDSEVLFKGICPSCQKQLS